MISTVGAPAALQWTPAGGGTVALAVVRPDGVAVSPAPAVVSGKATFTPTMPGRYLLTWSTPAERLVDVLDVWPADPHYGISLADAKSAIGRAPEDEERLQLLIAAATFVIEDLAGPIVPVDTTWLASGGGRAIALPDVDVTVSQVAVDGVVLDPSAYIVNGGAGVVYARGAFAPGTLNVAIAYRAGGGAVPANLRLAVMEQLRFLYQITLAGNGRAAQDLGYTPAGYAVPYLVLGLCQASPAAPGFA